MKQDIRIAAVGAGRWGRNIIKTLSQLGLLAAIVEEQESQGQQLAKQYNVAFYKSIDEVISQPDINAVAIATPVFTHFELAKKALLAGKDVFVEKPLTVDALEAAILIRLAKQNQCILMVGHLLLYQPGIQFINAFLMAGRLGKVYSIRQTRRSLGTIRKEENVLYSFGVHDLAVLSYLIPETIVKISAVSQEIITPGIADDVSVNIQFSSGIKAYLHVSWIWPYKDRQLMILGEKGALHFNENVQEVIYYQHYGNKDATVTEAGQQLLFKESASPLTLELQHFADCIVTRTEPQSPGEQGLAVVKLMADIMAAEVEPEFCYPVNSQPIESEVHL